MLEWLDYQLLPRARLRTRTENLFITSLLEAFGPRADNQAMNEADVGERTSFGARHHIVWMLLPSTLARIDLYLQPVSDRGCEG